MQTDGAAVVCFFVPTKDNRKGIKVTLKKAPKIKTKKSLKLMTRVVNNELSRFTMPPSVAAKPKMLNEPRVSNTVSLTKCALKYALACSDPFNVAARGACIPSAPAHPSQKVHTFARFTASVGTNNVGFIAWNPAIANDAPCIYYTDSTFTGAFATGVDILTATSTLRTGVVATGLDNLPYSSTQLTSVAGTDQRGVIGKIVAGALRIQYVGTTLNESGLYYCLQEPNHGNLSGYNGNSIGFYADADVSAITRKPCMLNSFAVTENELNWSSTIVNTAQIPSQQATAIIYPFSKGDQFFSTAAGDLAYQYGTDAYGTSLYAAPPNGVIAFTGVAGQQLHVEVILHVEYTGNVPGPMETRNDADADGAAIVMAATAQLPSAKLAAPRASTWSLMSTILKSAGKGAVKYGIPALESGLTALLL